MLWMGFTFLLALYTETSGTFGATYGPLTAVMALLLWSFLGSTALFVGLAFAAQLEACRAGDSTPARPIPVPPPSRSASPWWARWDRRPSRRCRPPSDSGGAGGRLGLRRCARPDPLCHP
nr:hypothetical protein GCM10020093_017080 [Planobispora longispora]